MTAHLAPSPSTADARPDRPFRLITTPTVDHSDAEISEWSSAVRVTPSWDSTLGEASMDALVLVVVVFVACDPPPLNEPLSEKANAPARVSAVIDAVS